MQQILVPPSPNWYGAHAADWAPELGLYAYAAQNTVVLLNTRAQTVRTMLSGHANRVTAVAFAGGAAAGAAATAADGDVPPMLVTGAADRSLRLFNLNTMQRLRTLYKRPAEVMALAVSSDGTTALIGDKAGSLFAWDTCDTASKPRKLPGCSQQRVAVACLAAAPAYSSTGEAGQGGSNRSSLVLAGYADGHVLLLDWRRDSVVQRLERHAREVQCVRWLAAPDPAVAAAVAAAKEAARQAAASKAAEEAAAAAAAAAAEAAAAAAVGPAGEAAGAVTAAEELVAGGIADEGTARDCTAADPAAAAGVPVAVPAEALAAAVCAQGAEAAADGAAPALPVPMQPQSGPQGPAAAEPGGQQALGSAAAGAASTAAEAAAALPPACTGAPPVWEVLLSSGADGALRLYSLPAASDGVASRGRGGSSGLPQPPQLVTMLRLPKPHGGLTSSQTSRLWFSAAIVPPVPPAAAAAPAGGMASAAAGEQQQAEQHVWLVSSAHSGSLLAWKVPLPSAAAAAASVAAAAAEARAAAFGKAGPPASSTGAAPAGLAVTPCRLPVSHGRTVFTVHAAAMEAAAVAAAAAAAAQGSSSEALPPSEQHQAGMQEAQQAKQLPARLQLLTTSMDRTVHLTELPHPAAAAAAVIVETPQGSWRRDAAAGAAAGAAWRQAAVRWRLTGLGGHVYSLSLLAPAPAAQQQLAEQDAAGQEALPAQQRPAQQQPTQGQPPEHMPAEQRSEAQAVEVALSDSTDIPPPPPPLPPASAGAVQLTTEHQVEQQLPAGQVAQAQGAQQPEALTPSQQAAEQRLAHRADHEPAPMLLAIGCGDQSIRVLPLLQRGDASQQMQQQQMLLWRNISDKVTAVAWQPLQPGADPDGAADMPSAAGPAPAAAASAAAAALAFGCADGSVGLMLPSREQSALLPVKHKGAVAGVSWVPAPGALPGSSAAVQLYSLSADGTLLLWGPLALPLSDLFASSSSAGGGSSGSQADSWAAPGGRSAAACLGAPLDIGARLAGGSAAADPHTDTAGASWLGSSQPLGAVVTAFAVLPPDSPAAVAAAGDAAVGSHLLAVAVQGGGMAVLHVGSASPKTTAAVASAEAALRLLWSSSGGSSSGSSRAAVSHLCFSADGWQLAAAEESGALRISPWAAEAGLLPSCHSAAAEGQFLPAAAGVPAAALAAASIRLDSAATALAWAPCSKGVEDDGSPGTGSGGMLAAALLSGGIQLADFFVGQRSSEGRLVPTALLRGHSGTVRTLLWLPPRPGEPEPQPAALALPQQGQQAGPVGAEAEVRIEQERQEQQQQQHQPPGDAAAGVQAEQEQLPADQALDGQPVPGQPTQEQQPPVQQQCQPKLLLLSGSEDQSVRLFDIHRNLQAWQQRQEAAAAVAAAEAVQAASAQATGAAGPAAAAQLEAHAVVAAQSMQAGGQRAASAEAPLPPPPCEQPPVLPSERLAAPQPVHATASESAALAAAAPGTSSQPVALVPPSVPPTPLAATPAAAPASGVAPAGPAMASTSSKKKAALWALGSGPILPSTAVPSAERQHQREAATACLQLAEHLLQMRQAPAGRKAPAAGGASAAAAARPLGSAAALLDCAAEPVAASLALQQAAAALASAASSAQNAASRHAMAQRAAAASLFRGDVGAAVQLLLEHDALTADFVSLSAAAGPAAWRAVTLAYADKLAHQLQEPHLAALHLLAVQEAEAAVQVYRRAGLLREAVALASARLLPEHPVLAELRAAYATQLSSQGRHEQAAAQHLAAGHWSAAAAALGSGGSAAAAAAAAEVCRTALGCLGSELGGQEAGRLEQQLAEAEEQLAERAAAEGTNAATVAAAIVPPRQQQAMGEGSAAGAEARAAQQRRRYSSEQLLAVASAARPASLEGLPKGLASHPSSGSSSSSRWRYTLQALLELSDGVPEAEASLQALRQRLPAELWQGQPAS